MERARIVYCYLVKSRPEVEARIVEVTLLRSGIAGRFLDSA
jgi:hypothetical protein